MINNLLLTYSSYSNHLYQIIGKKKKVGFSDVLSCFESNYTMFIRLNLDNHNVISLTPHLK